MYENLAKEMDNLTDAQIDRKEKYIDNLFYKQNKQKMKAVKVTYSRLISKGKYFSQTEIALIT